MPSTMEASRRFPMGRSAAEIRFSDVAHYVGLSLLRSPQKAPRKLLSPVVKDRSNTSSRAEMKPKKPEGEHLVSAQRLKCQLEWLRAEQRVEREELKKLEASVTEASNQEKSAHRRALKQKEMWDFHSQRAVEVERKIRRVREELEAQTEAARFEKEIHYASRCWGGLESDSAGGSRMGTGILMGSAGHAKPQRDEVLCGDHDAAQAEGQSQEEEEEDELPGVLLHSPKSGRSNGSAKSEPLHPEGYARRSVCVEPVEGQELPENTSRLLDQLGGQEELLGEEGWAGQVFHQSATSPEEISRDSPPESGQTGEVIEEAEGWTVKDYFAAADALERERDLYSYSDLSSKQQGQATELSSFTSPSTQKRQTHSRRAHSVPSLPKLTDEERAAEQERCREEIRREMVLIAGSSKLAFKRLDLNGSGKISLQEFADGVSRMGIDWQTITGLHRDRELFKLFDLDKDGVLVFPELFPDPEPEEQKRVSTPEFWSYWCRKNKDAEFPRGPKWQPASQEESLDLLFNASQSSLEAQEERKWMSATIRRLKNRGKSDARCREIVAHHLPRGTGPKDREDVQTFSSAEVRACKKAYNDQVNDPVRNIQKIVYDMREQRKVLHDFRQKFSLVLEPAIRRQMEEDRKHHWAGALGATKEEPGRHGSKSRAKAKAVQSIMVEYAILPEQMEEFKSHYQQLAEPGGLLDKKALPKLLQALGHKVEASACGPWWDSMEKVEDQQGDEKAEASQASGNGFNGFSAMSRLVEEVSAAGQKNKAPKMVNFEGFISWYVPWTKTS